MIVLLLLWGIVSSSSVLPDGYNSIMMIKIDGLSSPTMTGYDSFFQFDTETLILEGKMNDSCWDLIFVDKSGNSLDFFIETGCNTTDTHIFIRHPISNENDVTHVFALFGKNDIPVPSTFHWGNDYHRAKFAFLSSKECTSPLVPGPRQFEDKHIRITNLVNHTTSVGKGHTHTCDNNHILQPASQYVQAENDLFEYGNKFMSAGPAMRLMTQEGYCSSGYIPAGKKKIVVEKMTIFCSSGTGSPNISLAVYQGGVDGVEGATLIEKAEQIECSYTESFLDHVITNPSGVLLNSEDKIWLCFYADNVSVHWTDECHLSECDFSNDTSSLIDVSSMVVSGVFPDVFPSNGTIPTGMYPSFFLMKIGASDKSAINHATDFHNLTCLDGKTQPSDIRYLQPSIDKNYCTERFDEELLLKGVPEGTILMYDTLISDTPRNYKLADDLNVGKMFPIIKKSSNDIFRSYPNSSKHSHNIMFENWTTVSQSSQNRKTLGYDKAGFNVLAATNHRHNVHFGYKEFCPTTRNNVGNDYPMRYGFQFIESTSDEARFHPGMITFAYCPDCTFEQSLNIVPPGWEINEVDGDWVGSYIIGATADGVGRKSLPQTSNYHKHDVQECFLQKSPRPMDNLAEFSSFQVKPVTISTKDHIHPNSGTIQDSYSPYSTVDQNFPYFSAIMMKRKESLTTVAIVGDIIPYENICDVLNSTARSDSGEILWGLVCDCDSVRNLGSRVNTNYNGGVYCNYTISIDTVVDTVEDTVEDSTTVLVDPTIIVVTIVATSTPVVLILVIGAIAACIIVAVCCFGVGGIAAGGTLAKRKIDKMREGLKGIEMKVVDDEITQRHLTGKITKNLSPELRDDIIRICKEHTFKIFPYEDINLTHYITSGASGNIFKSQVKSIPNEVVFKSFVTDIDVKEFEREIVIFGTTANHPNFLKLHGACLEKNHLGLIVGLGKYGDLEQFIATNDKTSLYFRERCRILVEIADGFAYMHECGFIHRDIKPKNIVMDESVTPKIMDFGISTKRGRDRNSKRVGTMKYMAPECYKGTLYNEKVDIFSFGMTVYEVFTANFRPFGNEETWGVSSQKMAESPSYRPDLTMIEHEGILSLMTELLAHDPEKRPSFEMIKKRIHKIHSMEKDPLLIHLVTFKESQKSKGEEFLLIDNKFETLDSLIREKWKKCGSVGNILITRKRGNKIIENDEDVIKTKDDDVFICVISDNELNEA